MERSRRLREAKDVYASRQRTNGRITLSWLISHVRKLLVASQSWFVVSIVGEQIPRSKCKLQFIRSCAGAGIGMNAAIISIITEWLSDIKMGYCSDGWWLNQQFCCWELDGDEDSGCDSWHLWSTVSIARWFIYVLFAVRCYFPSSSHPFTCDAFFILLCGRGLTISTKRLRCPLSRLASSRLWRDMRPALGFQRSNASSPGLSCKDSWVFGRSLSKV